MKLMKQLNDMTKNSEPLISRGSHPRMAYNPYVDVFTYWDKCVETNNIPLNHHKVIKEVNFSTDENGDIMWLEIKDIHNDAIDTEGA